MVVCDVETSTMILCLYLSDAIKYLFFTSTLIRMSGAIIYLVRDGVVEERGTVHVAEVHLEREALVFLYNWCRDINARYGFIEFGLCVDHFPFKWW